MRPVNGTPVYRPDLGVVVMEGLTAERSGFVGLQIMPPFPVMDTSGTFPVIPAEALMKIPDTKRAPGSAYNRTTWEYEEGRYSCSEQGHEEPVDDTERKLLDRRVPGASDAVVTQRGLRIILGAQERRIANKIFNATNFTAHEVINEWDDTANATPITDVKDGKSAFRLQCGRLPDALVINWTVFENLKQCDQIVNRLKYTFPGLDINKMSSDQLAAVFDVPQVIVAGGMYDSANKGQAKSLGDIWSSEYAALVKIGGGMDITEPCIGRTFVWETDSSEEPIVEVYREEQIRGDVFRVRHTVDERLIQSFNADGSVVSNIAASCCYLFNNITTT